MERKELEKEYKQYIEELAQDALEKKPVNQNLLDIIDKVLHKIRDLDIVEAMNKNKENAIPRIPSINSTQVSENFTVNEFGEIVRGNNATSPKAVEFGQPMVAQPTFQMPQSDSQSINEELAKITSPKAAEFGQTMAAQPNYSDDYRHKGR